MFRRGPFLLQSRVDDIPQTADKVRSLDALLLAHRISDLLLIDQSGTNRPGRVYLLRESEREREREREREGGGRGRAV